MRAVKTALIAFSTCLLLCAPAWAIDVLVLNADAQGVDTLIAALEEHPGIDAVDFCDGGCGVPSATELAQYGAVFAHGNDNWNDAALLGDRLADYVDAGGGLVVDMACFSAVINGEITGRLKSDEYMPLIGGNTYPASLELDEFDALHPIMLGVESVTANKYSSAALASDASAIVFWINAKGVNGVHEEYVAVKNAVVGLNVYYGDGLFPGGDAGLVAANAVYWAYAWQQQPEIVSIDPSKGTNDGAVSVEIAGDFFIYQNVEVVLSGPAKAEIPAADIVVNDYSSIECDFDLNGAAPGEYDLIITTPGGERTLEGGFTVAVPDDDDDDTDDDDSDDDDDDDDSCCCG